MTQSIELQSMKREFAAIRQEFARALRSYYARKYDPNQPRVPAGSREGGQWAREGGNFNVAALKKSAAWCWNQMQIDMLYCASLQQPSWYIAACRAQANERYAACITGKPLPPLPF